MKKLVTVLLAAAPFLFLFGCVTARYGKLSYVEMLPPGGRVPYGSTILRPRCSSFLDPQNLYSDIGKALKEANLKGLKNFQAGTTNDPSLGITGACVSVSGEKE